MRVNLTYNAKWNRRSLTALAKIHSKAFTAASADIISDIKAAETLPYRTGALSDATDSAVVNGDERVTQIASRVPYAGLLYNRTDLRYFRAHNKNAGARWFEPYLTGGKKNFWLSAFATRIRKMLGGKGDEK